MLGVPIRTRGRSPGAYSTGARTRSHRKRSPSEEESPASGSLTSSPSPSSASSETPSLIAPSPVASTDGVGGGTSRRVSRKRKRASSPGDLNYSDAILEYFITESGAIPPSLINPPPEFNPDIRIDEDDHTALHWAAAMGRIRVVKLLLSAGADPFLTNKSGQTALMRSVMFANNYDVRKFAELFELLHRSTLHVDNYNRTVFHHIVDLAMNKGKTHAARYYMETALARLSEYGDEVADILNFTDRDGETALTMAARCRSKRLVKVLLDHGANPKLRNREGKTAEDYILEDERFRSSPTLNSRALLEPAYRLPDDDIDGLNGLPGMTLERTSQRTFQNLMAKFDDLVRTYETESKAKDRECMQVNTMLASFENEIEEGAMELEVLKTRAQDLDARKAYLRQLESESKFRLARRCRAGLDKWITYEEEREKKVWASNIATPQTIAKLSSTVLKGKSKEEDITDLAELYSGLPKSQNDIAAACKELRAELQNLQRQQVTLLEEYAKAHAESGTGARMADYRRLISAGLNNVSPEEVDDIIPKLLEVSQTFLCHPTYLTVRRH